MPNTHVITHNLFLLIAFTRHLSHSMAIIHFNVKNETSYTLKMILLVFNLSLATILNTFLQLYYNHHNHGNHHQHFHQRIELF